MKAKDFARAMAFWAANYHEMHERQGRIESLLLDLKSSVSANPASVGGGTVKADASRETTHVKKRKETLATKHRSVTENTLNVSFLRSAAATLLIHSFRMTFVYLWTDSWAEKTQNH